MSGGRSRYYVYWENRLDDIVRVLDEAYHSGISSELDVSDIQDYGEEESWAGFVEVFKDGFRGKTVHFRSLGKMVVENELLDLYEKCMFRMVISEDLKLKAERVDVEEESVFSSPSVVEEEAPLIPTVSKGEVYHRIHEIVESLPLYRYPVSSEDLPENGICFFYEEGEKIPIDDEVKDRIVRIETHKDEGGFRDVIFNHFNGDKNSSTFRRQLGGAIIRKKNLDYPSLEEWLKEGGSTFNDVEALIDEELREKFSFRYIRVNSEEERVDFEERLIASLALYACFHCSKSWLGRVAPSDNIRIFGLWNEKHLESDNIMTLEHLLRLEELVS
ncbi:MAG: hypothetical protein ACFFDT_13970 [Candidatus Hodarchaeota archaeon]